MSANLARTADGWWAVTPAGLIRLDLAATTTAGLLADRAALAAAIEAAQAAVAAAPQEAVPAESLELLSPVTAPARVVAQAVNYRSHATDSGFDPDTVPPAFFRKASHSITGPAGDIIRPDGVGFLDYEVELGLVIGADLPVGTTVTADGLGRYVAALVVANDVSARQVQLVKTQFYESKSYPTFTPVGPWLTLVDAADLARLGSLRLTLSVNGQVRQDSTTADMIVGPARALNGDVESPLVNHLLNNLRADADHLPLLQHVLMRMWRTELAENPGAAPTLSLSNLAASGGMERGWNGKESAFSSWAEVITPEKSSVPALLPLTSSLPIRKSPGPKLDRGTWSDTLATSSGSTKVPSEGVKSSVISSAVGGAGAD